MVKCAIFGAGITGLTCARALRSLGLQQVTVFESRSRKNWAHSKDRGLGLWNNAYDGLKHILGSTESKCLKNLIRSSFAVPPACYRSSNGSVLSHCTATEANLQRVHTIRSESLKHILKKDTEIIFDVNDNTVDTSIYDLVIIATGSNYAGSRREEMLDTIVVSSLVDDASLLDSSFFKTSIPNDIEKIVLESPDSKFDEIIWSWFPFETLHKGNRMAVVPLRYPSLFWFATVKIPPPSKSSSCTNSATQDTYHHLEDAFIDLPTKNPLRALISDGKSSKNVVVDNVPYFQLQDTNRSSTYSYQDTKRGTNNERSTTTATISIGDAAHFDVPHNLAQGASVGIEDAIELAYALKDVDFPDQINLQMKKFKDRRYKRIRNYRIFTQMTNLISSGGLLNHGSNDNHSASNQVITPKIVDVIRNRIMMLTPNKINSKIFDWSLNTSLGGATYNISNLWKENR